MVKKKSLMVTKGIGNLMGFFKHVCFYSRSATQKLGKSIGMCFESLGSGTRRETSRSCWNIPLIFSNRPRATITSLRQKFRRVSYICNVCVYARVCMMLVCFCPYTHACLHKHKTVKTIPKTQWPIICTVFAGKHFDECRCSLVHTVPTAKTLVD